MADMGAGHAFIKDCPCCAAPGEAFQSSARTSGHGEASDDVGIRCTGCGLQVSESDHARYDVVARLARCMVKWNLRTPASKN